MPGTQSSGGSQKDVLFDNLLGSISDQFSVSLEDPYWREKAVQEEIASKQRLRESFQRHGFYAMWGKAPESDEVIEAEARRFVNFFKTHEEYRKFKEKPFPPELQEVLNRLRESRAKHENNKSQGESQSIDRQG